MHVQAQKTGNLLLIEVPLDHPAIKQEKVARYIMCLYEFNFIPSNAKCLITTEPCNDGSYDFFLHVKPNIECNLFERKFQLHLRKDTSSYFKSNLEEAGFEVIQINNNLWEILKN